MAKLPITRLMLTDEHRSKLRTILLEDQVYDEPDVGG